MLRVYKLCFIQPHINNNLLTSSNEVSRRTYDNEKPRKHTTEIIGVHHLNYIKPIAEALSPILLIRNLSKMVLLLIP